MHASGLAFQDTPRSRESDYVDYREYGVPMVFTYRMKIYVHTCR